jgi:tol-pal system protein YbgF
MPAVAVAATAGCFATRSDVRLLQDDMTSMRAQSMHADSEQAALLDRIIEQLAEANDSLHSVSARSTKWQGDIRGDLYSIRQQLIQVQELTGQSQARLQELRAQLEHPPVVPAAAPAAAPAAVAGAAAGTRDTSVAAGPGPNQLFELALEQLRRGSTGAARSGFQDLLRQYPNADVAPDAQFYLADAYAREGKTAEADSGYQAVVSRYPKSARAPTALYKHAGVLEAAGETEAAQRAYQDVVKKYPRSDEAVLAQDRLRELK